mmetsp:Transcript_30886/g.28068  ORF Transcript_30886/g.28068 Transcript_30886/m.28068 type:complete len:135 (-) Transcript_30886:473-877(-)
MVSREEAFFHELIGLCSSFFYELHRTCQKHMSDGGSKKSLLKSKIANPADDDSDDDHKAAKKTKKKTNDPLKDDPNAPKKPIIQGYLLYFKDVRSKRKDEHPDLSNVELTKIIGQEWNDLPKEKKIRYEIQAKE